MAGAYREGSDKNVIISRWVDPEGSFVKMEGASGVEWERKKRIQTYINHNRLYPHFSQSISCIDGTPIEFNRTTNSVNTTSQNNGSMIIECNIVSGCIVCCVLEE